MSEGNRRTVRDLRRTNRSALLRLLYFAGPMSRQQLGPAAGLSSASVSNVTSELLAEGLLEEAGSIGSDGGRPRTLLQLAPDAGSLIGVDVGETRVRVELFDLFLREQARAERPLQDDEPYDVGHVVRLVADALATVCDTDLPGGRLLGVGVGVPGIVERASPPGGGGRDGTAVGAGGTGVGGTGAGGTGVGGASAGRTAGGGGAVVHGQTIGWDGVPLEALLREATRLPPETPLFVSNGAKALGQAETWFGAGQGARDAVVVLIGSGVGASLVTDGSAYTRAAHGAGEWGHTTLRLRGRPCRCGARGCLEAYVGATAVLDRWREAGGAPQGGSEESDLAELLAAGDPVAEEVLDETGEYLGAGIADLVNLFAPERIVLAGWAGLLLGPRLLPAVREATATHALRYPAARTAIELGHLGADAVTVGAATLPLDRFLDAGGRAGA
jgi:predicted NBD/HSP70 family sugar kinase